MAAFTASGRRLSAYGFNQSLYRLAVFFKPRCPVYTGTADHYHVHCLLYLLPFHLCHGDCAGKKSGSHDSKYSGLFSVDCGSAATCALLILYLYLQNKQISIDYLLGIPNHKEFLNSLQLHIKRHRDSSFTVLLISLRNFKQVNDTYGQQNGDEFLKTICTYLRNTVKPYQLYRYNGDEFAVLIPEPDKQKRGHHGRPH